MLRSAAVALGIVLWVVVPVAAASWLFWRASETEAAPPAEVWAEIRPNEVDVARPVSIRVERSPGVDLVAPAWQGILQAAPLTVGAALEDGTEVAVVDGVSRRLAVTERPFASPVSKDSAPTDVAMLNRLLERRGLAASSGSSFGTSTERGVRAYAKSIGVPGADRVESFDPGWVLYVPTSGLVLGSQSLQVGAPAPSAGETVITTAAGIRSAQLVERVDGRAPDAPAPAERSDGGEQAGGAEEAATSEASSPAVTASPEEALLLGSTPLRLDAARTAVDAADLEVLARGIAADATDVDAVLSTPPQLDTLVVPSAAVFSDRSGASCVIVGEGAPRAESVRVLGSATGVTIVALDARAGEAVLVSPPASERACG